MIPDTTPPERPEAARLEDLDQVSTHALRLLRMWSWGVVHRETIRLAAPTQFGATHGICVVGAFESLFAVLEDALSPELAILPPDTCRLTDDEVWFLRLVSDAGKGSPMSAMPFIDARVSGDAGSRIARSAEGFAQMLSRCLQQKDRKVAKTCPIACPIQTECADRPKLVVVK